MGIPTIEVVYATATEYVSKNPRDPTILKTSFSILKQQEGMLNVYFGLQNEDQLTTYHIVVWETLQHHYKLMNDPEAYPKLTASVRQIFDTSQKPVRMVHVSPRSVPYKAFEAPVLEIGTFTLKDGQPKAALEQWADELTNALNELPADAGAVHASWGTVVEEANAIILFAGWTSVEARMTLATTHVKFKAFGDRARALSDIEAIHVPMTLYRPS